MLQYAAIQHLNNEYSSEFFIIKIYQIWCHFMHAVPIYWVCCKIATMLHICCSMQLQPDFRIQELSQTVFKHNWVILYLYWTLKKIWNFVWFLTSMLQICCNMQLLQLSRRENDVDNTREVSTTYWTMGFYKNMFVRNLF